nr:zinc finger, CCHC-type [Tanacetum cinerariifolium]
ALSSCESEFMAATAAACQALWLKRLLTELTGCEEKRITLKVENVSAIALVRNPVFHGRSKHIDIRYHFIRECVENGHINKPGGRPITRMCQVLVASFRKRNMPPPIDSSLLFEATDKVSVIGGSRKIVHTSELK